MSSADEIDTKRRQFLKCTAATLGGIGVVAGSIPFVRYWSPSADTEAAGSPIKIDVSVVKPREQLTVMWRGKPIWIIHRTQEMLDTLPKMDPYLRDPNSLEDQQPPYAKNIARAIKPEFFIAIGVCTHLGCIPTYRPDVGSVSPEWLGGFYCPCHGSSYDLSGRVFKGVPAPKNIVIPPYMYVSDHEVLVGEDKEGTEIV